MGTAVIPLGLENPLRLAEDLATIDILSGGRLNPGVSVGTPLLYEQFKTALYPETHDVENFSKERVLRLLACLRGDPVSHFEGTIGQDRFFREVQPHSPESGRPGLVRRRTALGRVGGEPRPQLPHRQSGQH